MTISELISILQEYRREYGADTYVSLADDGGIIGDAVAVGYDSRFGDVVISTI